MYPSSFVHIISLFIVLHASQLTTNADGISGTVRGLNNRESSHIIVNTDGNLVRNRGSSNDTISREEDNSTVLEKLARNIATRKEIIGGIIQEIIRSDDMLPGLLASMKTHLPAEAQIIDDYFDCETQRLKGLFGKVIATATVHLDLSQINTCFDETAVPFQQMYRPKSVCLELIRDKSSNFTELDSYTSLKYRDVYLYHSRIMKLIKRQLRIDDDDEDDNAYWIINFFFC
ncbi:unnamed protein product [Schistosoma turkestanicum]|nr:unnamed protein product [Schistosoma turkestanicum]